MTCFEFDAIGVLIGFAVLAAIWGNLVLLMAMGDWFGW